MATLKELKEELEPYKNTLVIADYFNVVRLVDVEEDVDDFYWVYDTHRKGVYRATCVGTWTPLKGYLNKTDYDRLVSDWNRNNIEKAV